LSSDCSRGYSAVEVEIGRRGVFEYQGVAGVRGAEERGIRIDTGSGMKDTCVETESGIPSSEVA
jgi:hypothetical protein